MSDTLSRIIDLVTISDVRISEHGYDELAEDGISIPDILNGVSAGRVIEDYPDYPKGRSVFVLQLDHEENQFTLSGASRRDLTGQPSW